MKKLLIPLILLVLGVGGGVGAGLALAPAPEEAAAVPANPCGELPGEVGAADPHAAPAEDEHAAEAQAHGEAAGEEGEAATAGHEYVRLDNQFVVPVVMEGNVASMVLLSLSVEVPTGQQEPILSAEPKLRDAFLQVLFDHANTGGFEGIYTSASAMRTLRQALLAAAQGAVGETVTDVLIVEIVRQDT